MYFIFLRKSPLAAAAAMAAWRDKKKCLKASWRRCYYPHRSRDTLSPVCWIFLLELVLPSARNKIFSVSRILFSVGTLFRTFKEVELSSV